MSVQSILRRTANGGSDLSTDDTPAVQSLFIPLRTLGEIENSLEKQNITVVKKNQLNNAPKRGNVKK
jgi:hypothetical protein